MKKILLLLLTLLLLPTVIAQTQIATDDFECGAFNCGAGWTSGWEYTGTCEILDSNALDNYNMRGVSGCDATKNLDTTGYSQVNISFYATAGSLEASDTCYFYYNDGTTDHLLLTLVSGDDDNTHDYYEFDITSYGLNSNAGIKFVSPSTPGDYCYIDNIQFTGVIDTNLNIFTEDKYLSGDTNIVIEMSSSITNADHTIELRQSDGTLFCSDIITSPSIQNTLFSTSCDIPAITDTNAYATFYLTSDPDSVVTTYFDIVTLTNNPNELQISKVYYSPKVLQGGQNEIFTVIEHNNYTFSKLLLTLTYPDSTTRVLGMYPTVNENEYRALITDTYQTGNVLFNVKVEADVYYSQYNNQYDVLPFSVEYVANVGSVDKLNQPTIEVYGTEYDAFDNGKLFIQLLDGDFIPITNSTCFVSIYYPNSVPFKYKQEMTYSDEGLYYYDFIVPYTNGVYMASSYCIVGGTGINKKLVYDGFEGGISGGYNWSTNWALNGATFSTTNPFNGTYSLLLADDDTPRRYITAGSDYQIASINFYYKCSNMEVGEHYYLYFVGESGTQAELIDCNDDIDDGVWTYNSITLDAALDSLDFNGSVSILGGSSGNTESSDYLYIDELNIVLTEEIDINVSEYQIIRGSGEVHVSSNENFDIEIINGNITNESLECCFYLNSELTSQTNELFEEQTIYQDMFAPFDCHHVLNVTVNGVEPDVWYCGNPDDVYSGSRVFWEQNLDEQTSYNITIKAEKWFTQRENNWVTKAKLKYDMINIACENYQEANGLPDYTIPINFDPKRANDSFYAICSQYYDHYWHFNNTYYNEFETVEVVLTPSDMLGLDNFWYHIIDGSNELNSLSDSILIGMSTGADYSLAVLNDPYPPTNPPYTTYWANLSTNTLLYYQGLANPSNFWTFNNRTLTNATNIAPDIWGGNYTINSGLLGQLVSNVWDYVARYTHGIIN